MVVRDMRLDMKGVKEETKHYGKWTGKNALG
jgi:hypothetical protein